MKLSKQRAMLLAVLGAGGVMVGLDRTYLSGGLSGPQSAAAQSAVADGDAAAAASEYAIAPASGKEADGGPAIEAPAGVSLAQRLASIGESDPAMQNLDGRDAFMAAESWRGTAAKGRDPEQVSGAAAGQNFVKTHKLMAVMTGRGSDFAVIDGKTYLVGQSIDSFTIVALTQRSVVLERDGRAIELHLPQTQMHD